jgi:hypothetical protein
VTKGTRPGHLPQPSRAEEEGRVCSLPGCGTTLSVYNATDRCWQHAEASFPSHRGRRLRTERA